MATNIGPKIGIEGEAEFKKQINAINTSLKEMASEMGVVTSEFQGNENSAKALKEKHKVLASEIDALNQKLELQKEHLKAVEESQGSDSVAASKLRTEINKTQAQINTYNNELEKTPEETNEAAEATEKLDTNAKSAGSSIDILGTALSAAGAACEALASVASKVVSALVDFSTEGAAYADDVLTMSTQTGIATDTLQGYMYAADLVDVSTETLTASMKKQIKSMGSYVDGSSSYVEAYERLGVAVTDSNGEMRDSEEVYWEIIDALGEMENETERDELAMTLLGKSAQDLNPIIEQGSERMTELAEEAAEAGYILSEDALTGYGALQDNLDRLSTGATAAKNALGTALLPMLTQLSGDGVDIINEFTVAINECDGDIGEMAEVVGQTMQSIISKISTYIPQITQMAVKLVEGLASGILTNMPTIITAFGEIIPELTSSITSAIPALGEAALLIIETLGGAIVDALPDLLDAATEIILTLLDGLMEALPELTDAAPEIIEELVGSIVDNADQLFTAALECINTLANSLIKLLPELVPVAVDAIITLVDNLCDNVDMMVDAAISITVALADGLIQCLPTLIEKAPEIIAKLVEAIVENVPKLLEAAFEIISQLATGIIDSLPELGTACGKIISTIVSGCTNLISKIYAVGKNIVEGLWNGIGDKLSWLISKIKAFCSSALDAIKDFFGIASPSKVMKNVVGKNLALGIGEGFTDEMKSVSKQMTAAMPITSADFSVSGSYSGGSGASGSGLVSALQSALSGMGVYMDGKVVGSMVTNIQRNTARAMGA